MKSPFYFIVEPVGGKSYDNVRDNGLIVSSSKEDHKATNRFALVINTPIGYTGPVSIRRYCRCAPQRIQNILRHEGKGEEKFLSHKR